MQMLLQFVMFLVRRLGLSVEELVFAYACVERAPINIMHGTVDAVADVLGPLARDGGRVCVIACKVTRDCRVLLQLFGE